MEISEARLTDLPMVVEIYNQNLGTGNMDLKPIDTTVFMSIIKQVNPKEKLLVARLDEKVIGWCVIKAYSKKLGYRFTCELSTYIDTAHQGKGYGKRLKSKTLELCKSLGYRHVVGKILATNHISLSMSYKLGYTLVGIQKQAGIVGNDFVDIAILQYLID